MKKLPFGITEPSIGQNCCSDDFVNDNPSMLTAIFKQSIFFLIDDNICFIFFNKPKWQYDPRTTVWMFYCFDFIVF